MDYIEIKGFKSIKDAIIELKPINILIGSNGSGKSNFLSFFEFLNQLYESKVQEYVSLRGGDDKILHNGGINTSQLFFKTEFDNGLNGYSAVLKKGDSGLIFTEEYLIYEGDKGRNIAKYTSEAYIKQTDHYRAKYVKNYLRSIKKYHFHETGRNAPFNKLSQIENDIYYLYEKGENIAAFLYHIKENNKTHYNRIIQTIQSIAPFFSDFFFQPNTEGYLKLQWQDKYSSTIYGATDLSDGTIRFIALATLFMQPKLPSTIIIDEPELGLHPFAITKLAGMIQSVASRNVQVIVATQSADLINHFTSNDIITVDQMDGESHFKRLEESELNQWLVDYSIGELWQRNIIHGGQPN
jgi:predicted ATPase